MVHRGSLQRRLAAVAAVCALSLFGCADSDDTPEPVAPEQSPPSTPEQSPAATPPETTPTPPPTGGAAGPPLPPPGSCVDLPEAADGRYTVGDAGTAVVRRDGDRLVVDEVVPSSGWTHRVTEHGDDEIEIDFRRGGEELELEVEIDDGRVEVDVCVEDHDDADDNHRDNHRDDDRDDG